MTDTEQYHFDLGVKAGLQAAIDLVADRAHCEHDRFQTAFGEFDDDTVHEALIRRNFAADILHHLGEIRDGGINGRYPTSKAAIEFNPYSDLSFKLSDEDHRCEFCGSDKLVSYSTIPHTEDDDNDHTKYWICYICCESCRGDLTTISVADH